MGSTMKDKKNKITFTMIHSRLFRWFLVAAWMALIFFFSAQNAEKSSGNNRFVVELLQGLGIDLDTLLGGNVDFIIRKLAHMTEYFLLLLLVYNAVRRGKCPGLELMAAFMLTVAYAATDEFHQYFVPGRACALRDVGIDSLGAAAAVLLIVIVRNWKTKKE